MKKRTTKPTKRTPKPVEAPAPVEATPTRTAAKVLNAQGEAFHRPAGTHAYPLPKQNADASWEPGAWQQIDAKPILCARGFHLTRRAAQWWQQGARAWLAEYDGAETSYDEDEQKFAVSRVRLLRPLTEAELAEQGVFLSGEHQAKEGSAWAYGNATVTADGNATVTADGNATVTAYGNATVTAYGNATVTADGNATVRAWGGAKSHAAGRSTCTAWRGTTLVCTRSGEGVIVDRRGAHPVAHVDGAGLDGWSFVDGAWLCAEAAAPAVES